jgi:hypothetical protein
MAVRSTTLCHSKFGSGGWKPDISEAEALAQTQAAEAANATSAHLTFLDPTRAHGTTAKVSSWIRASIPEWMRVSTEEAWLLQSWAELVDRIVRPAINSRGLPFSFFRAFILVHLQNATDPDVREAQTRLMRSVAKCPPRVLRICHSLYFVRCSMCHVTDLVHLDLCCDGTLCQTVELWPR